jgi:hypothetical protein
LKKLFLMNFDIKLSLQQIDALRLELAFFVRRNEILLKLMDSFIKHAYLFGSSIWHVTHAEKIKFKFIYLNFKFFNIRNRSLKLN